MRLKSVNVSDILSTVLWRRGGKPEFGFADCATLAHYILTRKAPDGFGFEIPEIAFWVEPGSGIDATRVAAVRKELSERLRVIWKPEFMTVFPNRAGDIIESETVTVAGGPIRSHLHVNVNETEGFAATISVGNRPQLDSVSKIQNVQRVYRWL